MELNFPKRGKCVGLPASKQPLDTSQDLNNVRPYWDGRLCGGQRPGMGKVYTQRIASAAIPVVAMCSVTTVEVT